jgi:GNAT superfamily N-acetyltransferase
MLNGQLSIRDAVWDDIEPITQLMEDMSYPTTVEEMEERFKNIIVHPDYRTILAIMDGEILGLAGLQKGHFYEKNGNYLRVLAFVVKQTARKHGVGRFLLKTSEQWAAEQGLNAVIINSGNRDDRKVAHEFYQKLGYVVKSSGFVKQL